MTAQVTSHHSKCAMRATKLLTSWRHVLALMLNIFALICAEEKTIMENAKMKQDQLWDTSIDNALYDLCFKTRALTDKTENYNGRKEMAVILSASYNIITTFVLNGADNEQVNRRLGRSFIYAGENETYLSSSNKKCTEKFFDTGFYQSTVDCKGSIVAIRRVEQMKDTSGSDINAFTIT